MRTRHLDATDLMQDILAPTINKRQLDIKAKISFFTFFILFIFYFFQ